MKLSSSILGLTGAQALVETLGLLKVDRVFGLPGIQNIELFDALADAPFSTLTPTNESAAVFMADAHARVTGKIGVAVVTAGPGLTNALTGIAEAKLGSSPVLVLVSTGGGAAGKSYQLHQIDHCGVASSLVKACFKPAAASEISQVIWNAAHTARDGEPSPVVVEVASPLLMERIRFSPPDQSAKTAETPNSLLDEAARRLRNSPTIGIYAGVGAMGATEELKALAELLQAPVATTISGRGVLAEDHPLSVGYGFGRTGTAAAWRVFRKIQTLLAVGCKYGETATGAYGVIPPLEHIHINADASAIGANYPTTLAIAADAKIALSGLVKRLEQDRRQANTTLQDFIQQARTRAGTKAAAITNKGVSPGKFLRLLRRRLERDALMVADSGAHQFWALSDFPIYTSRSFLAPTDYQAMGFSIPAAISAKLALPDRQVVSLVGDGGFLMSGFELLNAVRWNAKIIIVVFRDGAWGLIKEAQQRVYRRTPFTAIPNPDFRPLADSFGLEYIRLENDNAIEPVLDQVLVARGTVLVEVNVGYAEAPPYVKGVARQMFHNLPYRFKAGISLRLAKRSCSPFHAMQK